MPVIWIAGKAYRRVEYDTEADQSLPSSKSSIVCSRLFVRRIVMSRCASRSHCRLFSPLRHVSH